MKNLTEQQETEELFQGLANNIYAYVFENNALNNDLGLRVANQNLNKHKKIIGGLRSPAISAKSLEKIAEEIEFLGIIDQTITKNKEFQKYLRPQSKESLDYEDVSNSIKERLNNQQNKLNSIKSVYFTIYNSFFGINNFRYLREICDGYRGSGKKYL